MPSWRELLQEFEQQPDANKGNWLDATVNDALQRVAEILSSNVVLYASAFLQKPQAPPTLTSISLEDLNGMMAVLGGMRWDRPLALIIHTPGGSPNAAETIVGYLRSKFASITAVVPAFAFSAGTMIALGCDRIIMGRQSQLGPIDPQLVMGAQSLSAQAIVDQFEAAKAEIEANPILAHAWAPIIASIGPALLKECQNALTYGEDMVSRWLKDHMFRDRADAARVASGVAKHFNDAKTHRSHGRRIDRQEAADLGLSVTYLEDDQNLQDAVLTAYHCSTIIFEKGPACKLIRGSNGALWIKNSANEMPPQVMQMLPTQLLTSPTT